jgi:hypothetical protein
MMVVIIVANSIFFFISSVGPMGCAQNWQKHHNHFQLGQSLDTFLFWVLSLPSFLLCQRPIWGYHGIQVRINSHIGNFITKDGQRSFENTCLGICISFQIYHITIFKLWWIECWTGTIWGLLASYAKSEHTRTF